MRNKAKNERSPELTGEIDGKRVDRDHPIQDYLDDRNVGDVVALKVLRNGADLALKVPLTERK